MTAALTSTLTVALGPAVFAAPAGFTPARDRFWTGGPPPLTPLRKAPGVGLFTNARAVAAAAGAFVYLGFAIVNPERF